MQVEVQLVKLLIKWIYKKKDMYIEDIYLAEFLTKDKKFSLLISFNNCFFF